MTMQLYIGQHSPKNGKKKYINKYYLACAITGHQYYRKHMAGHQTVYTERSVTN